MASRDEPRTISNVRAVAHVLIQITKIPNDRPYLAFDMEGTDLGRAGVPCYLQIRYCYHGNTYLINVLILNSRAFTTPGLDGLTTLQEILEDERLIKMIHDCRQDSDALFRYFGVKLAGVCDIQLMSMLVNRNPPTRRPSLYSVIWQYANLSQTEMFDWISAKNAFSDRNNSHQRWMVRPLPKNLEDYAANDVLYKMRVYDHLFDLMTVNGHEMTMIWTKTAIQGTWRVDC